MHFPLTPIASNLIWNSKGRQNGPLLQQAVYQINQTKSSLVNFDEAVFKDERRVGIGIFERDESGQFVAEKSTKFQMMGNSQVRGNLAWRLEKLAVWLIGLHGLCNV